MKKRTMSLLLGLAMVFLGYLPAQAHFGLLIPSESMLMEKSKSKIKFDIAFCHPFEQSGMPMAEIQEFFVADGDKRTDLMTKLKRSNYYGEQAFSAEVDIQRPGVYRFGMTPAPYFEKAEDSFIIHYTKTVIGAYGADEGWDEPLGLPMEIIPYTRPFANYAGNTFTGLVLKNGKPLAKAPVEVEFLNSEKKYNAPNEYFVTQTVYTDANGFFTFGIPWAGWWGFAALANSDEKMVINNEQKDVELGGVLWINFSQPAESGK